MLTPIAGLPVSAADSARAAASVYTASLLATVPVVAAVLGAVALRRAAAEARVLVWRAAIGAMLIALFGRAIPLSWTGLSVPSIVADPLIALGRIQVADLALRGAAADRVSTGPGWINIAIVAYMTGVVFVLLPTILGSLRARVVLRRARSLDDEPHWSAALADARSRLGIAGPVSLSVSNEVAVPMTWGFRRPVVLLPVAANNWNAAQRRIVLRHELAHVCASDWAFGVASRLVCALYWFHPGAWLVARALKHDAEQAADERVIASGIARSDYAELLIVASTTVRAAALGGAFALTGRGPLRTRLAAILDQARDVRPLARRWSLAAAASCVVVAAPLSAVELAPTRDVLSNLVRDARWESRAYAVIGLARRSDSIAVARSVAEQDPSPRVRAWARYALGLRPETAPASAAEPR
jgi:beta-lactamase regulating signal transducer with metallopeptidase domain